MNLTFQALNFLLQRPNEQTGTTSRPLGESDRINASPRSRKASEADEYGRRQPPMSPMSLRSFTSSRSYNDLTPKAHGPRSQSAMGVRPGSTIGKRSGAAANDFLRRHDNDRNTFLGGNLRGNLSDSHDFDVIDADDGDDPDASFEGLENVRGEFALITIPLLTQQPAAMVLTISAHYLVKADITTIILTLLLHAT